MDHSDLIHCDFRYFEVMMFDIVSVRDLRRITMLAYPFLLLLQTLSLYRKSLNQSLSVQPSLVCVYL